MDNYSYFQGVAIATSVIALFILIYVKLLRKRLRRYVLRNDKIEKYFERDNIGR